MTTYAFGLALWMVILVQLPVNNEAALTENQRAVLPFVELAQTAILQSDRPRLLNMFETSSQRLAPQQVRDIAAFVKSIENPSDLLSCVIFDTACARVKLGLTPASKLFVSVKDFLQDHKSELRITFHDVAPGTVQAEIHLPRRPNSASVPPPAGTYESLTLGFIRTDGEWRLNILFPEAFRALSLR